MKKKIVALCLVLALALTAIGGATLAYFTDDEQATNTMVIGNVKINIEENVKNDKGQYEKYEDGKFVLYPVANDEVYNGGNFNYYNNKIVRTFNTSPSKNAAYIRTIILFEKNDNLDDNYVGDGDSDIPGLHFMYVNAPGTGECADGKNSCGSTNELLQDTVTVNGNEYWVVVFTAADEKAIAYDDSLHTINGVWMDKNITEDQIRGWGDDGVQVIVYSQGIQSEGLTHDEAMAALGTVDQSLIDSLAKVDKAVINDWAVNN